MEEFLSALRLKEVQEGELRRSETRDRVSSSNRAGLFSVKKKIEPPSIEEFRKVCGFFAKSKSPQDLERVVLGLSQGPKFVEKFLDTPMTVSALVGCLSGVNARLQVSSLRCLGLIGYHGDQNTSIMLVKKVGVYVVTLMSSGNPEIQTLCFWATGSLCGSNPSVCDLMMSLGLEEAILEVLETSIKSSFEVRVADTVKMACYALNLYLFAKPDRIGLVLKNSKCLIGCLGVCVENSEMVSATSVAWSIFTASTIVSVCQNLVDHGMVLLGLNILKKVVTDKNKCLDVSLCTALIRVLTNCVALVDTVANEICYSANDFAVVIETMVSSPSQHLREESWQLVANVINQALSTSSGKCLLEDSSLMEKLKSAARKHPKAVFDPKETPTFDFS